METNEGIGRPTPEEAAAALAAADEAGAAGDTPFPGWAFPATAVLLAAVMLLQADWWHPAVGAVAALAVLAGLLFAVSAGERRDRRLGVKPRVSPADQVALALPVALLWVAGQFLDEGRPWLWAVLAAITAVWVLGYGAFWTRRARRAR
ncbi:hypothetical protein [Bailinhaonella thermotolerans]|uniref:hypothetical protein n=1 Tax=Bailinhaonella thermotolerans TaxID=1070861 RepID=UPI00192A619D|nr:hypothetical protein [Bailinhaonella thermotolerans]